MKRPRIRYETRSRYDALGLLLLAGIIWFIHLLCALPSLPQ